MITQSLLVAVHERRPHYFEVALAGRLDTESHGIFTDRMAFLAGRPVHALHLDLDRLSYISSMGLRAIMALARSVRDAGGAFSMSNLQPQIAKVFEIANVLPKEEIFSSVEDADRYYDAIQRKELAKRTPPTES